MGRLGDIYSPTKPEHHHVELREVTGSISGESLRIAVKPAHQCAGLIGESTDKTNSSHLDDISSIPAFSYSFKLPLLH